jgi:hypothetical protein
MLQVENPAVMHCLRRASECDRLAETAVDDDTRDTIRRMAERWRSLAQNPEYIQRMEGLLATSPLNGSYVKYLEGLGAHRP